MPWVTNLRKRRRKELVTPIRSLRCRTLNATTGPIKVHHGVESLPMTNIPRVVKISGKIERFLVTLIANTQEGPAIAATTRTRTCNSEKEEIATPKKPTEKPIDHDLGKLCTSDN